MPENPQPQPSIPALMLPGNHTETPWSSHSPTLFHTFLILNPRCLLLVLIHHGGFLSYTSLKEKKIKQPEENFIGSHNPLNYLPVSTLLTVSLAYCYRWNIQVSVWHQSLQLWTKSHPICPSRALVQKFTPNILLSIDHWQQNINLLVLPSLKTFSTPLHHYPISLLPFADDLLENIANLSSPISLLLFSLKIDSNQACALTTPPKLP